MDKQENIKTIFSNTIVLYIRMLVILLVSLYTSRVVLRSLGFEDFGTYNVVGGVVALFSFLKSSMASSTQRFLSYAIGQGDEENLSHVFSICVLVHVLMVGVILLLAETVGLWFVNTHLNIPAGRETAAYWVYQFSVFSLCIGLLSIPYMADIISRERMGFYAWVGIIGALMKLGIAFIIMYSHSDRLIEYGFLIMCFFGLEWALYWIFCRCRFKESRYRFYWNTDMFKQVFSLSGWNVFGQFAIVGSNAGTKILVNIFHTVVANAALGISGQVNDALRGFVTNFQTAFKPQIVKSYAAGDWQYCSQLTHKAAKISFFLLFNLALPLMLNIDWVLGLWLGEVPAHAGQMCIIFLVAQMFTTIYYPLWTMVLATGKIKQCQIAVSIAYLLELVGMYILFRYGLPLVGVLALKAVLNFVLVFIYLFYAHRTTGFVSSSDYLRQVLLPAMASAAPALAVGIPLVCMSHHLVAQLGWTVLSMGVSLAAAWFIGFNANERAFVKDFVLSKFKFLQK